MRLPILNSNHREGFVNASETTKIFSSQSSSAVKRHRRSVFNRSLTLPVSIFRAKYCNFCKISLICNSTIGSATAIERRRPVAAVCRDFNPKIVISSVIVPTASRKVSFEGRNCLGYVLTRIQAG